MEDQNILDLYFARSEQAIQETDRKYGRYCYSISYGILSNEEDAKETVSDTYLSAWKAIPPRKPAVLRTFLGKITRNLSINRWNEARAEKRGGGEFPVALEELGECISQGPTTEEAFDRRELSRAVVRFLDTLGETEKRVFLCRYWYFDPVDQIARQFGYSHSKVTSMLYRSREKLKKQLQKEGLV